MAPESVRTRRSSSLQWQSDSQVFVNFEPWPDVEKDQRKAKENEDVVRGGDRIRRYNASADFTRSSGYDSCSGLPDTPRSRRTLRRTVSVLETPAPETPRSPVPPALDTIFSPSYEILHPMQSMKILEKSVSPKPVQKILSVERPAPLDSNPMKVEAYKLPHPVTASETKVVKPADSERAVTDESKDEGDVCRPLESTSDQGESPAAVRNIVVIIVDAERRPTTKALDWAIRGVVRSGDEIIILGVLKHVTTPMGSKMVADAEQFSGVNKVRLELEMKRRREAVENKISDSGRRKECEEKNVKLSVRIAPGAQPRSVVVRELKVLQAKWAIFERKVMKDRNFYGKHLSSCHVVRMRRYGRSAETITLLTQASQKSNLSPTSDTSSVSSLSTDSASSEPATIWSRIARFRSSRRSSPQSQGRASQASSPAITSPTSVVEDSELDESFYFEQSQNNTEGTDNLTSKLRSFYLGQAADHNVLALPSSCVVAENTLYKRRMDTHGRQEGMSTPSPVVAAS